MRKLALLVTVAVAASAPSIAFAAKKAAKAPETLETLNKDTVKAIHDFFIWPSEAPAKKGKKK